MDRDCRAGDKARAMNRPAGHGLRQRHELDARKKVDRQPRPGARIVEDLRAGHCVAPSQVDKLSFRRLPGVLQVAETHAQIALNNVEVTGTLDYRGARSTDRNRNGIRSKL
jgi:hypothetical protein